MLFLIVLNGMSCSLSWTSNLPQRIGNLLFHFGKRQNYFGGSSHENWSWLMLLTYLSITIPKLSSDLPGYSTPEYIDIADCENLEEFVVTCNVGSTFNP